MLPIILLAPLVAAVVAGFGRDALGPMIAKLVTTITVGTCAVLSWVLFLRQVNAPVSETIKLMDWFTSGDLAVSWSIRFDTLTAVMLVVVTTVAALVHLYSWGYMEEDPDQPRFFAYLSLFTFAMLALVTADNLIQLFFGWEGVGLASYLLIGFWYYKPSANAAAIKAFVVNRVGDFGFALGIFGAYLLFGTVQIGPILAHAAAMHGTTILFLGAPVDALTCICLLLFLGACGKSAQIGLHTWLPDAMEGPTPVSALIHAATMVTAGVFLVCRMSPLFEAAPHALTVVTYVGAATALFAATVGTVQTDIKRVIAYSTCSQLGYMFFAAGVSAYGAAMFHLFTHAFFKALLFLGAGSVIHAMHHEQDMKFYGGLRRAIPFTFAVMMIGTLAITGVVPFAGYFSKDATLEAAWSAGTQAGAVAFVAGSLAALLTSFYSWRLILLTFAGAPRWAGSDNIAHASGDNGIDAHAAAAEGTTDSDHATADTHHAPEGTAGYHPHESPISMLVPLALLALGAALAGWLGHRLFTDPERARAFWHGAIAFSPARYAAIAAVPGWVSAIPTAAWVLGLVIALNSYVWNRDIPASFAQTWRGLYTFLLHKWYFDELYDLIFVRPAFALGRLFWRGDKGVIDAVGADGVATIVADASGAAKLMQSGYVYSYALVMLVGVAAAASWLIFRAS
jgi:NADH-quinone oxidoreductase subunit L